MPSRSLGRAALVLLGSTWGYSALGLLASVLVGRTLGPDAVGAIALNLGLAGLVMAALVPGFSQAHLKRLAEGLDAGRCLGTMAVIQGALAVLLLAVLGAVVATGALARPAPDTLVFLFMLAAQVTGKFSETFLRVFVAREWVVGHGAVLLGARVARVVATVIVLGVVPSVVWVAATFWMEALLSTLVAAVVLARVHGIRMRPPTRDTLRAYWTYARPFLVTTPIALVQDSLDRVLVGRWAGLAAAGYYHVARGLWEALAGVLAPPGLLLFTRLSGLYAERSAAREQEARALFFRGLDKLLFVTAPLALAFWALAAPLVTGLYGAEFLPAAPALRVLVLAALAANVVNPYTFVLQARDEVGRLVPINVFRLALYCLALVMLVPPWALAAWLPWLPSGATGAAFTRVLVILVPSWVWIRWVRELAGIPFYARAWTYVLGFGAGLVAFHAVATGLAAAGVGAVIGEVTGLVAALAVYAVLLARAHPDARENLRYTVALVTPRFVAHGRRRGTA